MTPRELGFYAKNYVENEKGKAERLIIQAYYTAALVRCKKLPDLEEILKNLDKEEKQQTDEEMFNKVMALNKAFGGEVVIKKE